jgi:hypothetical protein
MPLRESYRFSRLREQAFHARTETRLLKLTVDKSAGTARPTVRVNDLLTRVHLHVAVGQHRGTKREAVYFPSTGNRHQGAMERFLICPVPRGVESHPHAHTLERVLSRFSWPRAGRSMAARAQTPLFAQHRFDGHRRERPEGWAARPDAWAEWLVDTSSYAPSRAVPSVSPSDQRRDVFPMEA